MDNSKRKGSRLNGQTASEWVEHSCRRPIPEPALAEIEMWLSRDRKMLMLVMCCRVYEDTEGQGLYMSFCPKDELYRLSDFIEAEEWYSREFERLEIMHLCQPTGESKWKTL